MDSHTRLPIYSDTCTSLYIGRYGRPALSRHLYIPVHRVVVWVTLPQSGRISGRYWPIISIATRKRHVYCGYMKRLLILLLLAGSAHAEVYKSINADGEVVYSDTPTQGAEAVKLPARMTRAGERRYYPNDVAGR